VKRFAFAHGVGYYGVLMWNLFAVIAGVIAFWFAAPLQPAPPVKSPERLVVSGAARPSATPTPPQVVLRQPDIPRTLSIPSIGLTASILPMSRTLENIVETPDADVGWYRDGPRPGEMGSVSLNGHFIRPDLRWGVFHDLSLVKSGDTIDITDMSGIRYRYRVTGTESVNVEDFPVMKVYGAVAKKFLNLVTCAGSYDAARGTYTRRTIVYAEETE
jgi:sortase (surface protein transpeptidase)